MSTAGARNVSISKEGDDKSDKSKSDRSKTGV